MAAAKQLLWKRRKHVSISKTDSMYQAERNNGQILDQIWSEGNEQSFHETIQSKASVAKGDAGDVDNGLLRLNIGGTPFLILVDSILRADPTTFLVGFVQLNHQTRLKVADAYLRSERAYYFQRSPLAFEPVLQYYATGVVHKPPEECPSAFNAELEFWRISHCYIGACCAGSVSPMERVLESNREQKVEDISFDKMRCGRLRRQMWNFLERPYSSLPAKTFELCSTLFVMISVLGLSFGTIPDFQMSYESFLSSNRNVSKNGISYELEKIISVDKEHLAFQITEGICIAFFTIEYCLRLFAAPKRLDYVLRPIYLVDLFSILPFYIELALMLFSIDNQRMRDISWAFLVVRFLRVLRVIRIIKLGRFSSGLQTFGMTLQRSQKQLQMMAIVLLTGVVFFSTMIYFLEKDETGTPFSSIPAAYWWCIVTMTTVGYGDIVPATVLGKVIASAAIMCGILVLALPITIIVDNFIKVSQEEQQMEQFKTDLMAMEEQEKQQALEQQKRLEKINEGNANEHV